MTATGVPILIAQQIIQIYFASGLCWHPSCEKCKYVYMNICIAMKNAKLLLDLPIFITTSPLKHSVFTSRATNEIGEL